jgi:hypothetical protein
VRRGRLVAQVIYLLVAVAFVVASTWEVKRQAFGPPLRSSETGTNCSYLVDQFERAITRGLARAADEPTHTRGKAEEAFEDVVVTPLSAIEKHCTSPEDVGAFAAAKRLKETAEDTVDSQQAVLAPLRAALLARKNP